MFQCAIPIPDGMTQKEVEAIINSTISGPSHLRVERLRAAIVKAGKAIEETDAARARTEAAKAEVEAAAARVAEAKAKMDQAQAEVDGPPEPPRITIDALKQHVAGYLLEAHSPVSIKQLAEALDLLDGVVEL